MKELLSAVGIMLVFLTLCFLFLGEPDVWDKLHAAAMARLE